MSVVSLASRQGAGVRSAMTLLAPLFEYPDEMYGARLDLARASMDEVDEEAMTSLQRFANEIEELDRGALEATFTATFDLSPSCLPYVGAHLFEPESRDRARLMVGLRMVYRQGGHDSGIELPDHIAEVLHFAPRFEDQDWIDLIQLVLEPASVKMARALEDSSNPYRHLISVVLRLCRIANLDGGES